MLGNIRGSTAHEQKLVKRRSMTCPYRNRNAPTTYSTSRWFPHRPVHSSRISYRRSRRRDFNLIGGVGIFNRKKRLFLRFYFSFPLKVIFHFFMGSMGSNFNPSAPNSSSVPNHMESGCWWLINSPSPGTCFFFYFQNGQTLKHWLINFKWVWEERWI